MEKNLESFFSKHKNLLSLLYLLAFSFLVFVSLFVCYCCANLVYRRNLNDKLTKPGIKQLNEVTPNAKMNSFLEKTMNSMKKVTLIKNNLNYQVNYFNIFAQISCF